MSRRTPHNAMQPEQIERMHQLLCQGMAQRKIGYEIGCVQSTVADYYKRNKLEIDEARGGGGGKAKGTQPRGRNNVVPRLDKLVAGAEKMFHRLLTQEDPVELAATAKAASAMRGMVDTLYKIYRLERGEVTSHTLSERETETRTVEVFSAKDPLRILKRSG